MNAVIQTAMRTHRWIGLVSVVAGAIANSFWLTAEAQMVSSSRSDCIRSLLYPNGIRDERVNLQTAAFACRNANVPLASQSINHCIQSLLYPNGIRNEKMTLDMAANACNNEVVPFISEKVTNCVHSLMYPNQIRDNRVSEAVATSACRANSQKIMIIQSD